ncbi:MAG: hypothetical protein ACK559_24485, partial [bacterium]
MRLHDGPVFVAHRIAVVVEVDAALGQQALRVAQHGRQVAAPGGLGRDRLAADIGLANRLLRQGILRRRLAGCAHRTLLD